MSGSSGIVMLQRPSLFVSDMAPPGHSPETFTSLAFGARTRKVTERSGWTSGETSALDSRRGDSLVRPGVEAVWASTEVRDRVNPRMARAVFIVIERIKAVARDNSTGKIQNSTITRSLQKGRVHAGSNGISVFGYEAT